METHSATAHTRAGAALADSDALQLGAAGRYDAFFPRGSEKKRSPLSGSGGRGRSDSRTARLPAVAPGYRVRRPARPCPFRLSKRWPVGIDCALARHRAAWAQAGVSQLTTVGLELL